MKQVNLKLASLPALVVASADPFGCSAKGGDTAWVAGALKNAERRYTSPSSSSE